MSFEECRSLIRRFVHDAWNEGRVESIHRDVAPPLRDVMLRHHAELHDAFAELHVEVEELIAQGDLAAARLVVSGRHSKGPFAGAAPSGRHLRWESFRFYRIADGRIVETWAMQDRLSLMRQLGLVPPLDGEVTWADGEADGEADGDRDGNSDGDPNRDPDGDPNRDPNGDPDGEAS